MFYTFYQNTSGGYNKGHDYVIVEADSADDANARAQEYAGVYFYGTIDGRDCKCCGNRWFEQSNDANGSQEPEVNGKRPEEVVNDKNKFWNESCGIYYKNGHVSVIATKPKGK